MCLLPDNFAVRNIQGVEISYPVGGGLDPIQDGSFHYEVAGAEVSVRKRRFYVNGAYRRTLHEGDRLEIPDNTVRLNGRQIFPELPGTSRA